MWLGRLREVFRVWPAAKHVRACFMPLAAAARARRKGSLKAQDRAASLCSLDSWSRDSIHHVANSSLFQPNRRAPISSRFLRISFRSFMADDSAP